MGVWQDTKQVAQVSDGSRFKVVTSLQVNTINQIAAGLFKG